MTSSASCWRRICCACIRPRCVSASISANTCGPVVFVPESKRLNVLLKEFRRNRNHMAIVVDEYGGVSGVVTIEDVIEQIVGEIDDEFDVEDDNNIRKEAERQFTVRGVTRIEEFNEYFSAHSVGRGRLRHGGRASHEAVGAAAEAL